MSKSTLKMPSRKPDLKALSSHPSPVASTTRKRKQQQDLPNHTADDNTQKSRKAPKRSKQDDKPEGNKKTTTRTRAGTRSKMTTEVPTLDESQLPAPSTAAPVLAPAIPAPQPKQQPKQQQTKAPTTTEFKTEARTQKQTSLSAVSKELQKAKATLTAQNTLIHDVLDELSHAPTLSKHHTKPSTESKSETTSTSTLSAATTTLAQARHILSIYRTFCETNMQEQVLTSAANPDLRSKLSGGEREDVECLVSQARGVVERETEKLRGEVQVWFEGGGKSAAPSEGLADGKSLSGGRYLTACTPSWSIAEGVLGQVMRKLVLLSG